MNGRGFDCLLIPVWLFVWFTIAMKYQFMKPFESSYDSNGKAIVITYQDAINNVKEEAARTAQLAKEAAEIKASYAQAYKDCNGKSYNKIDTTSAIDVKYFLILMIKLALNTQPQQICEKIQMPLMKTIMFKFWMK